MKKFDREVVFKVLSEILTNFTYNDNIGVVKSLNFENGYLNK